VGKNVTESNKLIDYISSKGYFAKTPAQQITFKCNQNIVDSLIEYIDQEFSGLIKCTREGNIFRFAGYNGDLLTFTFYPQNGKAMIQGKPFQVFSIIISFLAELPNYSFDQIVSISNSMTGKHISSVSIREEMRTTLSRAYVYLDEALLKSISGSISLLKQENKCEDYTGCLTGIFKAIEGYLKKLLTDKYGYTIQKNNTFCMFYRGGGRPSSIDCDTNISAPEKSQLVSLNSLYSNKRNVFLHTTVDPSQTRIIENKQEAQEIALEILNAIRESYDVIYPEQGVVV
jgi:hypothetical protein